MPAVKSLLVGRNRFLFAGSSDCGVKLLPVAPCKALAFAYVACSATVGAFMLAHWHCGEHCSLQEKVSGWEYLFPFCYSCGDR